MYRYYIVNVVILDKEYSKQYWKTVKTVEGRVL